MDGKVETILRIITEISVILPFHESFTHSSPGGAVQNHEITYRAAVKSWLLNRVIYTIIKRQWSI